MISLRKSILLSALLHVGLFCAFFLLAGTGRARIIYKPDYQVRLVEPSEVPALEPKKARAPAPPKPAPPPPKPPPEKKEVALPPKKEEKPQPPKKEPPRPEVAKPEPKPEKKEPPPPPQPDPAQEKALEDVLARLEKDLSAKEREEAKPSGGGAAAGWKQRQEEIRNHEYYDQVERRVRENWIPPRTLEPGGGDVMTVVSIALLPDGRVLESFIEESSGDPLFDQSVMRALLKASPLPPPPLGGGKTRYELGLRFHSMPHAR